MVCCQQKRTKWSLDIRSPRGWGNTYSWSLICQIRFGNCELSNMEFIDGVFSPPQVSQNNASSRLFGSPSQTMRHRLKSGTPTECRSGSSTAAARILPGFRDIFVQKANCICPNCKIYLYELQNIFATKDSRPIWPLCWLLENRPRKTLFGTSWPGLSNALLWNSMKTIWKAGKQNFCISSRVPAVEKDLAAVFSRSSR